MEYLNIAQLWSNIFHIKISETILHFLCSCSYLFAFILSCQFYWHIRLKSTAFCDTILWQLYAATVIFYWRKVKAHETCSNMLQKNSKTQHTKRQLDSTVHIKQRKNQLASVGILKWYINSIQIKKYIICDTSLQLFILMSEYKMSWAK